MREREREKERDDVKNEILGLLNIITLINELNR